MTLIDAFSATPVLLKGEIVQIVGSHLSPSAVRNLHNRDTRFHFRYIDKNIEVNITRTGNVCVNVKPFKAKIVRFCCFCKIKNNVYRFNIKNLEDFWKSH